MSVVTRETSESGALKNAVRLVLPYPVSANRYWASSVPRGWQRAVTYVTPEAKAYKREVAFVAQRAGIRTPTDKPIEIGRIVLCPPATRLRRDKHLVQHEVKNSQRLNIDNCIKVTLDAFNGIVYVDDAQIERIRGPIEYGPFEGAGSLIVEIGEFVPEPPPLFAQEQVAA